jgi:glycosyltransferase involved in cell wall biosynthesis
MKCKKILMDASLRALYKLGFGEMFDNRQAIEATNVVSWFDFDVSDLDASVQVHDQHQGEIVIKRVIWFIPEINNPFWGGIHTILRFASYFKDKWGVSSCFAVIGNTTEDRIRTAISSAFPNLKNEEIMILQGEGDLCRLEGADISICTLWTTAFFSLKFNNVKRKFYFIQDYEPLFYPASSVSALVEETYRFGFFGITNTVSLKKIYDGYYGGSSCFFNPSINQDVFYPPEKKEDRSVLRVFFYARPGHPRNGFELGIAALKQLKQRMGDSVEIVTAGSSWSPEDYGVLGVIENLGTLKYEETADLYRRSDVGLAMMFTRHPSYLPLEFMACGCCVVTNYNPATTWLLEDMENCLLSRASASYIADTLHRCLTDSKLREYIINNGLTTVHKLSGWDEEIEKIFDYMYGGCCHDSPVDHS